MSKEHMHSLFSVERNLNLLQKEVINIANACLGYTVYVLASENAILCSGVLFGFMT